MSDPILNPDTETADLRVADPVRDLAEDIAGEVVGCGTTMTKRFGPDWIEARIRAFLAEQGAGQDRPAAYMWREIFRDGTVGAWKLRFDPPGGILTGLGRTEAVPLYHRPSAGALAALRGALEQVAGGCGGERGIKGRCQACARHDVHQASCVVGKALASDAGRKEAEVLRAAVYLHNLLLKKFVIDEEGDRIANPEYRRAEHAFSHAVDALLAARGGEGEG